MNITDAILGLVFVVIGFVILFRNKPEIETFQNQQYLISCPPGTNSFYETNGDMLCCNGTTGENKCSTIPLCSMSSRGTDTELYGRIRPCIEVQREYYEKQAKLHCPAAMSTFYIAENQFHFCTDGPINETMNGPLNTTQASCRVYTGNEDQLNFTRIHSCHNEKTLEEYPCFGTDCTKEITLSSTTSTPLISLTYTDPDGIRHSTITKQTFANYIQALKEKGSTQLSDFDVDHNILITEVSKAVFIDKTMDKSQVQF